MFIAFQVDLGKSYFFLLAELGIEFSSIKYCFRHDLNKYLIADDSVSTIIARLVLVRVVDLERDLQNVKFNKLKKLHFFFGCEVPLIFRKFVEQFTDLNLF